MLQGELLNLKSQSRNLQDEIAKRALSIAVLDRKPTALSLQSYKPSCKCTTKSPTRGTGEADLADGYRGDDRLVLSKLTPFSGNPSDGHVYEFVPLLSARMQ